MDLETDFDISDFAQDLAKAAAQGVAITVAAAALLLASGYAYQKYTERQDRRNIKNQQKN